MTDENENGSNGGESPLTAETAPVLAIQPERLTFITGSQVFTLKLEDILKGAAEGQGPIGVLLYALVLKMHDVDASFRKVLELTEGQIEFAKTMQANPAGMVEQVLAMVKEFGLPEGLVPRS